MHVVVVLCYFAFSFADPGLANLTSPIPEELLVSLLGLLLMRDLE